MKFLTHLKGVVSDKTEYSKGIYELFKLEAKLAGLNLLPCVIGLIVLLSLTITVWLSLMVLVGYVMHLLTEQPITAIITVLLLNLGIAAYLIWDIKLRLQEMSFARTRDCLKASDERSESEPEERATESHNQDREEG